MSIQLSAQEQFYEFTPERLCSDGEKTKLKTKNIVKISPLNLLTLSYELGMERFLNNRNAVQLSLSYFGHLKSVYYTREYGFRISGEQRYYFNEYHPSSTKNYLALETYYMYKEFLDEQTQVVNVIYHGWFGVTYEYATDLFKIERSYIAFAPKLGYVKQYKSGFFLDCYIGIGLRFVDTDIYSINGILEYLPYEKISNVGYVNFDFGGEEGRKARYDFEPRKFTEFYFPFNFKIGCFF